jgi:hypothetical protein
MNSKAIAKEMDGLLRCQAGLMSADRAAQK